MAKFTSLIIPEKMIDMYRL